MEKQFEYKGYSYWVKIDNAIHTETKESGYIAYVNDEKPGPLLWGTPARDHNGNVMFFVDKLTALTNANAIKKSEIDGKK